jgi:membrane-associated PAP2 superfamily phosphatase
MGDHEAAPQGVNVYFDALQRATRTWWEAISAVLAVAVGTALIELLQGADVLTWDFWVSVLRMVIVAVLTASAAYWMRFKRPPADQ